MFTNRFRRRRDVLPVDAPASLPLDQSPVPDMVELEAEVTERIGKLIAAGATDEFCAHALDGYLDAWHAEVAVSLAGLAMEQRRVDRSLVDTMQTRADNALRAAELAEQVAQRNRERADRAWAEHDPAAPVTDTERMRLVR
ncbi:hypothetical protein [Nocardia sp. NPDC058705]|uniref:hypothetical protein n=1 Tax=Nocardia sp. NPDC058705 TaxID=3346609 RepID=UPI0036CE4962